VAPLSPQQPVTLSSEFRRHLPAYAIGTVMLATFQVAMNRIDWLSKSAVDLIFGATPREAWKPAATIFALAILAFFARVASRWFMFNAGRDVEYEVRTTLLDRLHRLGAAFYRTMSAGEIMSRSTNDLAQVRLLFGFGVLNIVNVVFAFASALQVMLRISVRLSLASFITMPLLIIITRSFSRGLFTRNRENQGAIGKLSEVLQQNLAGVRVVRSFALETQQLHRFQEANKTYLDASLGLARLRGSMGPMMGAVSATSIVVFTWYGGTLVLRGPDLGGISRGDFFAFWQALGRMTWPMVALGFSLSIVQRGRASWARIQEVFDAKPEIVGGTKVLPQEASAALTVSGLAFKYGARAVLDDVSFEVPAGRSLAIVGRTGSGKTTLAMLLARLLPTPTGSVRIGGADICDLPLSDLRASIGYAQQDAFLFSTTVAGNIGFALAECDSNVAMDRIRHAASEAYVLGEVEGLPEQFDTVVGERGVQLSGGQKQRIALARALVWEPRILVLDDPLSAVDAKTEQAILGAIERQAATRTVVLITHRVAAAARCDAIVVLDNGKIVERGTHEELSRAGGIYETFANEQKMASELEEVAEAEVAMLTPTPAVTIAAIVDAAGAAGAAGAGPEETP
jgi:ATP-binding cassette subfamily B multidrug efflux pump